MKSFPLAWFFSITLIVCFSSDAASQNARVTVVEAKATENTRNEPVNSPLPTPDFNLNPPVDNNVNASNNDVVMSLYLQLEALQLEVQSLRGLVEEQTHQMRKMQTEQRDRYLDIDGRLSGISSGGRASVSSTSASNEVGSIGRVSLPDDSDYALPAVIGATSLDEAQAPAPQSEQETYRNALNLLLEDGEYESSITLFQQYIDSYPTGRYLTNAYYWQGEALILVERYNQAKDVFLQVTTNFPQDPKAPGAMLKLGIAYDRMGDKEKAVETWSSISSVYPENTTEIQAAEELKRKFGGQ